MADYALKSIPEDIWNKIRHIAKEQRRSIRGTMLMALESYIKSMGYIKEGQSDMQSGDEPIEGDIF